MIPEAMLMTVIAVSLLAFCVVRYIARAQADPDPWDAQDGENESPEAAVPLCTRCLSCIADDGQHYCPNCGNTTGTFTPYVSFVNIRHNYSLSATLWGKLKSAETPFASRIISALAILITTPLVLLAGLPLIAYKRPAPASVKLALTTTGAIVAIGLVPTVLSSPYGRLSSVWAVYTLLAMAVHVGLLGRHPVAWRCGMAFAGISVFILALTLLNVAFKGGMVGLLLAFLHLGANGVILASLQRESARRHFGAPAPAPPDHEADARE